MKISVMAIALAIAFALPVAAHAASCGVPQGYGTSNPNTFNRSTCGPTGNNSNSYATPNAANQAEVLRGSGAQKAEPTGYGTTNPYVPNSGAAKLGSNTSGN
jgi:hypothetical protein